jgi:RNA polymerase sigma-70 factor (ECF subfamily)
LSLVRSGDEDAFASLVDKYSPSMLRVAAAYVPSLSVAQEVVQETWLAVLEGLPRFEGRAALRTWIFQILLNRAKTRGERERRSVPFSSLGELDSWEPAVDASTFRDGQWASSPGEWQCLPEDRMLSAEIGRLMQEAINALPPVQRSVLVLRDVQGLTAGEACNALGLTETNQRVLLHRARSKVRRALGKYLETR